MAIYTTLLKTLIDNNFDLGLDKYPIFNEEYRKPLNQKIINHLLFCEIGAETAELFKFYLNRTLNEIMPYYNQLYNSALLEFNPFENVDKVTTSDNTKNSNGQTAGTTTTDNNIDSLQTNNSNSNTADNMQNKTTSKTDSYNKNVSSDTPQGLLKVNDIDSDTWATNADIGKANNKTDTDSQNTSTTTNTANSTNVSNSKNQSQTETKNTSVLNDFEKYITHVKGKSEGETYSEMLIKFRETFLNIDMMIINDLEICFMRVY